MIDGNQEAGSGSGRLPAASLVGFLDSGIMAVLAFGFGFGGGGFSAGLFGGLFF